jgi:hypothetical protein
MQFLRWLRNDRLALRVVLITLWGVGIAGGFWLATEDDTRPAAAGAAPTNWPNDSQIRRSDTGWTILMFVHPRCPCSRASLAELSRITQECSERVTVHLAFIHPDGTPADWAHTSLWEAAARMPGIQVTLDKSGREAGRFGAHTSGQTYLYDSVGQLAFSGGITGSRGHYGANHASDLLVSRVRGETTSPSATSVFGCPLRAPCMHNCEARQ